jgi:hypothetical protein
MSDKHRVQAPAERPGGDCHENIPKDADGNPIFLILPSDKRAKYERKMANHERAWHATKDPAYAVEAMMWARAYRQPLPGWLYAASIAIATKRRTKRDEERYFDAMRHRKRYETVCAFRAAGLTLEKALDKAVGELAKGRAAASRSTIEASYKRVQRELRANRSGWYQPLRHVWRLQTINTEPLSV